MGDELARLVHDRFNRCQFKIPSNQWTVLAGIAIRNDLDGSLEVVSIGAGLKCLPLESYQDNGLNEVLVHDCHGEILARRAFLAFLLDQIKKNSDDCCMEKIGDKWHITGVFDLMEAYFGDGEADLSRTLATYGIGTKRSEERAYAFLQAYFDGQEETVVRPGFRDRFAVYMLMDRMIIWSYGRKLGWFDGVCDFRTWCEPQMAIDPGMLP